MENNYWATLLLCAATVVLMGVEFEGTGLKPIVVNIFTNALAVMFLFNVVWMQRKPSDNPEQRKAEKMQLINEKQACELAGKTDLSFDEAMGIMLRLAINEQKIYCLEWHGYNIIVSYEG